MPVVVAERSSKELTVVAPEPLREVGDYPTPALVDGTTLTRR